MRRSMRLACGRVHQAQVHPALTIGERRQLLTAGLKDSRRRGDVLRAGVHVPKIALDWALSQRAGTRGLVDKLAHIVRHPGHVVEREAVEGLLPRGELLAAVERFLDVRPYLKHERTGGAELCFSEAVGLLETVVSCVLARAADLGFRQFPQ